MKYNFFDDYSEGAHPAILEAILQHNEVQALGYGKDQFCDRASERIADAFGLSDPYIQYIQNGTAANVVCLSAMLKPIEAVIAPMSGHINIHEAGALEAAGRKIISFNSPDGKLTKDMIDVALANYEDEHSVRPRAIYLTQVTELGTLYSLDELYNIIAYAKSKDLLTYLDGARLAMAIASNGANMTMKDVGALDLDMFYIGGTKNGGLYGEAIVVNNPNFKDDLRTYMKQHCSLQAKARFIGQQFERFFAEDNLWYELAGDANNMASVLYQGLIERGVEFANVPHANQVFPILEQSLVDNLEKECGFYRWQNIGGKVQIRLVCSWATKKEKIDGFLEFYDSIK